MKFGAFYDLDFSASGGGHDLCHFWSLISGIGENALDEWEPPPCGLQQHAGAISILNIGGQHAHAEEETERVDEDMALAARNFLARIEALRVNDGAPF